jgi:adenylate cyclase
VLRFHSFRAQLLAVILALVGGAQLAALALVATVHRADARREIRRDLAEAARQFRQEIERGNGYLARTAEALSSDYAFKQIFALHPDDAATLRSALESFRLRAQPDVVAGLALDGRVLAETRDGPSAATYYRPLVAAADASADLHATGYGLIDGALYALTAAPVRAPDAIAWIVLGNRLDQRFLAGLKEISGVEITLRHRGRTLVTTTAQAAEFLSVTQPLPLADGDAAEIVLQYSWDEKLAPARRLERLLALAGGGSLAVAALLAVGVARGMSRPVRALAAHTEHVARGDYTRRLALGRADELGRLATAFNRMSEGLAERDRIRDLLDKNLSPAVAAQLLREGTALGGEEREVTVLFVDLCGFTPLSEKMAPCESLALLNRFFDRMSAALEREGGVIDKFNGDSIMALFGAPVAQPDATDRALRAALGMQAALAELNRELAAEGRPALACGVGINTARVVAGNVGSHRRLNYSVIGDGVNVAERLEALTRRPEYRATVLLSEATLHAARGRYVTRALGAIAVRGRTEPVRVHALDAAG